jgi:hypothetical protein
MEQKIFDLLTQIGNDTGLPADVWYPIVMFESRGNPLSHALTSKEDSRGLFQVNIKAHPNANSSKLFDPEYNAKYQMPYLARVYKQGYSKGLRGEDLTVYVERYGQRPSWNSSKEASIRSYYQDYKNKYGGSSQEVTEVNNTSNDENRYPGGTSGGDSGGALANIFSGALFSVGESLKTVGVYAAIILLLIFSVYMIFKN